MGGEIPKEMLALVKGRTVALLGNGQLENPTRFGHGVKYWWEGADVIVRCNLFKPVRLSEPRPDILFINGIHKPEYFPKALLCIVDRGLKSGVWQDVRARGESFNVPIVMVDSKLPDIKNSSVSWLTGIVALQILLRCEPALLCVDGFSFYANLKDKPPTIPLKHDQHEILPQLIYFDNLWKENVTMVVPPSMENFLITYLGCELN